jgi:hypothetical protein
MGYSFNRFLKTVNESDKTIKIYDDRNYPVHTINPFSVLRVYVTNNNITIVLSGNVIIVLDFLSNDESSAGLVKLQSHIDTIKQNSVIVSPITIDDAILSSSGIKSFNGSTASAQNIIITNDSNIEINIETLDSSLVGTSSVTSVIHNLSVNWTGILPMERGGLNNTVFTPNQILISNLNSVISSGYAFNDNGTGVNDIWSADKILKQISTTAVNKEKPNGLINGLNRDFTLLFEPVKNSEHLYLNGLLQDSDVGTDYAIVGNKITFYDAPMPGDKIRCSYTMSKKTKVNYA